jgi:hypothetical protein
MADRTRRHAPNCQQIQVVLLATICTWPIEVADRIRGGRRAHG